MTKAWKKRDLSKDEYTRIRYSNQYCNSNIWSVYLLLFRCRKQSRNQKGSIKEPVSVSEKHFGPWLSFDCIHDKTMLGKCFDCLLLKKKNLKEPFMVLWRTSACLLTSSLFIVTKTVGKIFFGSLRHEKKQMNKTRRVLLVWHKREWKKKRKRRSKGTFPPNISDVM